MATTFDGEALARIREAEQRVIEAETRARIAEERQLVAEQRAARLEDTVLTEPSVNYRVYTTFLAEDIVRNVSTRVTDGLFTGGTGSITSFFTSSAQSSSFGNYYYDIYDRNPNTDSTAEVQFSIAYGNVSGSGAPPVPDSNVPTKAIYFQHRNLLLNQTALRFTFAGSVQSDGIYVINISRSRLKLKMDAGNWELRLKSGTRTVRLIDDSLDTTDINAGQAGRIYNIVSGTLNLDNSNPPTIKTAAANEPSGGYGLFYPDLGMIVLNPLALSVGNGFATSLSTASYQNNHGKLYNTITYFAARNEEVLTSTHYFVKLKNREYNYSTNPTFYSGSEGEFRFKSMVGDPKVYVSTIGLYNSDNEQLAVARLSRPVQKSFTTERIIKVRLDF